MWLHGRRFELLSGAAERNATVHPDLCTTAGNKHKTLSATANPDDTCTVKLTLVKHRTGALKFEFNVNKVGDASFRDGGRDATEGGYAAPAQPRAPLSGCAGGPPRKRTR